MEYNSISVVFISMWNLRKEYLDLTETERPSLKVYNFILSLCFSFSQNQKDIRLTEGASIGDAFFELLSSLEFDLTVDLLSVRQKDKLYML